MQMLQSKEAGGKGRALGHQTRDPEMLMASPLAAKYGQVRRGVLVYHPLESAALSRRTPKRDLDPV